MSYLKYKYFSKSFSKLLNRRKECPGIQFILGPGDTIGLGKGTSMTSIVQGSGINIFSSAKCETIEVLFEDDGSTVFLKELTSSNIEEMYQVKTFERRGIRISITGVAVLEEDFGKTVDVKSGVAS